MSDRQMTSVTRAWRVALCGALVLLPASAWAQVPSGEAPEAPAPAPTEAPAAAPPASAEMPPAAAPAESAPAPAADVDAAIAAAAAPPAPATPGDETGFFSEGAGDVEPVTTYPRLELSGFTDFTFVKNISPSDSPLRGIVQPRSSFSVGNLNVYFNAALAQRWKVLAEVRFMYLPQGNTNYPTAPGQVVEPFDASIQDYANDNRPATWGAIQIQRVQIDYTLDPLLTLRFGQWLTPVGVWNVDHGSPVVISVYRPYIVGQGLFPERQTGIQAFGEWSSGTNVLGYTLSISNGRGPSDAYADLDENKALGGRLSWTNTSLGAFTVGVSGYKGSYASRDLVFNLVTPSGQAPVLNAESPATQSYREQTVGADVRYEHEGLLVQGEVMQHEVVYDEGLHALVGGAVNADFRERGFYALAGYRTPWFGTMPFAIFETYDFGSASYVAPGWAASVGLNIRPEPTVVLKLQANVTKLGDDSSKEIYRGELRRLLAQLALAF